MALIGPKPEWTYPRVPVPLTVDGNSVLDADGHHLFHVDTDHLSISDDGHLTQEIVGALNAYFEKPKTEPCTAESRYPYPVPDEPDHFFVAPNWVVYDTRGPEAAVREFKKYSPNHGYPQQED